MTSDTSKEFGKLFREWRVANKLKQSDLSRYFCITKYGCYWSNLEAGISGCDQTLLDKIYAETGISSEYSPKTARVEAEVSSTAFYTRPSEFCEHVNTWRCKNRLKLHDLPKVVSPEWGRAMYTQLCKDAIPIREDILLKFYEVIPELKGLIPRHGVNSINRRKTSYTIRQNMYNNSDSRCDYLRRQSITRCNRLKRLELENETRRASHTKAFLGGLDD